MEHTTTLPVGPERAEVLAVAGYLSALNSIFERTLLGKKVRVFTAEGTSMQRLEEGFQFFTEWAEELVSSGAFDSGVESELFLAWQVSMDELHSGSLL